ncbi:MAG: hypothetical protein AB1679_21685 [Actinomycetota bacterium]|jgi:hypothetical protein
MKLGPLPRGLAVAALAAATVVPFAASAAGAAPAAPTAYALYGSAQPLRWVGSPPVSDLVVPFVEGKTGNLALARADAKLAEPDEKAVTLSGDAVEGLNCIGYTEKTCNKDAFVPSASAEHPARHVDPRHAEQAASFSGPEGKWPGSIQAVTDCAGRCGEQVVRSIGRASASSGRLPGYVRIGSSSASHDLHIDDRGRLFSTARSELKNVSIGPKDEVRFSSLLTTAQGSGTGALDTKDGKADVRITDFFILDHPVELTRAGLRLANPGPSEQEAYDGAKVLLQKLRERGIVLQLPDFNAQLVKTPQHVAVDTRGLRVTFEHSAGPVQAGAVTSPLELGRATAVVAAVDANQNIEVKDSPNGVVVETTAPTAAPVVGPGGGGNGAPGPKGGPGTDKKSNAKDLRPGPTGGKGKTVTPTPGGSADEQPATPGTEQPVTTPSVETPGSPEATDSTALLEDPNTVALPSLVDVQNKLGLRDARSVSRAFGAFLGLGLILPLARFVIRRLG